MSPKNRAGRYEALGVIGVVREGPNSETAVTTRGRNRLTHTVARDTRTDLHVA